MPITALYALPIALLYVVLAFRVIGYRRANHISVGDGGDPILAQRMRVQANCVEYAPFGLLLLALAESLAAAPAILHGIAVALVAGRIAHALGMSARPQIMPLRVMGMVLTLTSILAASLAAAAIAVQRLF